MDNYDDFVGVDLKNAHYTDSSDVEYSGDEDVNDVESNGHQSLDNEDDVDNDDDEGSVRAKESNSQAVIGDRLVSINFITSDEIRDMNIILSTNIACI